LLFWYCFLPRAFWSQVPSLSSLMKSGALASESLCLGIFVAPVVLPNAEPSGASHQAGHS
jgi:hypothetical protein